MHEYLIRIRQAASNFQVIERRGRQDPKRYYDPEKLNELLNEIDGCSAALRELINQ